MSEMAPNTNQPNSNEPPTEPLPIVESAREQHMNALYGALENDDPTDEDVALMRDESLNISMANLPEMDGNGNLVKNAEGFNRYAMHYYYKQPGDNGELIEMHPAYAERLLSWKPQQPGPDESPWETSLRQQTEQGKYLDTISAIQRNRSQGDDPRVVTLNPQHLNYATRLLTDPATRLRTLTTERDNKGNQKKIEVTSGPELMRMVGLGALQAHAIFEELQAQGRISKQDTTESGKFADSGYQINNVVGTDDGGRKGPSRKSKDDMTKMKNKERVSVGLPENTPPTWVHGEGIHRHVTAPVKNTARDYGRLWKDRLDKLTGKRSERLDNEVALHHRVKTAEFNADQQRFYAEWDANRLTNLELLELPDDAQRIVSSRDGKEIYEVRDHPYGNVLNYLAGKYRTQDVDGNSLRDVPFETTSLEEISDIMVDRSPLLRQYAERDGVDLDRADPDDPAVLRIRDEVKTQIEPFARMNYKRLIREGGVVETVEQHNGHDVTVARTDADKILELRLDRDHEAAIKAADRAMDETFRTNEATFNRMYDAFQANLSVKMSELFPPAKPGLNPAYPDTPKVKNKYDEANKQAMQETIDDFIVTHRLPASYRSLLVEGMRRVNAQRPNPYPEVTYLTEEGDTDASERGSRGASRSNGRDSRRDRRELDDEASVNGGDTTQSRRRATSPQGGNNTAPIPSTPDNRHSTLSETTLNSIWEDADEKILAKTRGNQYNRTTQAGRDVWNEMIYEARKETIEEYKQTNRIPNNIDLDAIIDDIKAIHAEKTAAAAQARAQNQNPDPGNATNP